MSATLNIKVGETKAVDGAFDSWGPAWWGVILTAGIGIITLARAAWDTLTNLLGLRDRAMASMEAKEIEIRAQVASIIADMKGHVGAVHEGLLSRIGTLENRTNQNYELITTMRVDIASKMVTREELRDMERSLKDHLDTALKQLITSLKDKD